MSLNTVAAGKILTIMKSVPIENSWSFCPRCGTRSEVASGNPFACSECRYTHYFSPCTAVGALIVDASNQMLFIVRGKDPGKGKLGLPGGFVDSKETAETALIREIKEELNLDVSGFEYLASFPNEYAYGGVIIPVTDLFFVTRVASLENIVIQEVEVHDWKFLNVQDVLTDMLAFRTHEQAIEAFRSANSEHGDATFGVGVGSRRFK